MTTYICFIFGNIGAISIGTYIVIFAGIIAVLFIWAAKKEFIAIDINFTKKKKEKAFKIKQSIHRIVLHEEEESISKAEQIIWLRMVCMELFCGSCIVHHLVLWTNECVFQFLLFTSCLKFVNFIWRHP